MLRENCGRRGAAGSDFAGARVSAGSSAVVASRGGHPRAAGRRRGRATAWVWCSPREKESQPMGVAGSSSISWTTFLRSQSPGFCDAFSSGKAFQRFSRGGISILAGWARPLGGCWRGGPPPPRPDGGWPPDPRPPPLPRPEGGALFCIEVVCVSCRRSLLRSSVVARRRARDEPAAMAAAPRRRRRRRRRRCQRDGDGFGVDRASPAGQPRWRRSWELGGSRPLAAVRVPRKSRCGGQRAPHAAPASAMAAAAAAATSPRAPPAGRGGACARGGPSGAGEPE